MVVTGLWSHWKLYSSTHGVVCAMTSSLSQRNRRLYWQEFVLNHTAAVTIQKHVRGFLVRRKLSTAGFNLNAENISQRISNYTLNGSILEECGTPEFSRERPLQGLTFVTVGAVPNNKGKKMTKKSLHDVIKLYGGRVKQVYLDILRGFLLKSILYYMQRQAKRIVPLLRALANNYHVLSYQFIYDVLESKSFSDVSGYELDLQYVKCRLTKSVSLHNRHFNRQKKMVSMLKFAKCRFKSRNKGHCHTIPSKMNIAQFSAHKKR